MIKSLVILFSSIICSEIVFNYSGALDLLNKIESIEKEESLEKNNPFKHLNE